MDHNDELTDEQVDRLMWEADMDEAFTPTVPPSEELLRHEVRIVIGRGEMKP